MRGQTRMAHSPTIGPEAGLPQDLVGVQRTDALNHRRVGEQPAKRATGLCLEAHISEGQGVTATFLVRDGTLRRGDVILCGSTYGRARMMYDDLGRPIEEAGPSMPVRLMGLEEVPDADDTFLVVPELQVAREIAEVEEGKAARDDNVLKNAPHTHRLLLGEWKHPYSKEKAFFPLKGYPNDKYWPPVGRVDNVYGDRNLMCICPPMANYMEAAE